MRRFAMILPFTLAVAACASSSVTRDGSTDAAAVRAQIESLNALWAQAFVDGTQADAVPRIFAPDAVRIGAGRDALHGVDAIRENATRAPKYDDATFELVELEVSGDLAYTREAYTVELGGESYSGRSLVVWKRQPDATWKIHRIMFD